MSISNRHLPLRNRLLVLHAKALLGLTGCWFLTGCQPASGPDPVSSADTAADAMPAASVDNDAAAPFDLLEELERREGIRLEEKEGTIVLLDLRSQPDIDDFWVRAIAAQLRGLRNLQLEGSGITDASMETLAGLDSLAALSLQKTLVSDAGVSHLAALRNLKELSLLGSPVTDASLTTLAQLPRLVKLRLRGTKITGEQPAAFADLTSVVDLELAETDLTNAALEPISRMPKLQKLNLWLTKVDDAGIENLRSQTGLTLLNLDNVAGINDASLDVVAQMPNLNLLHLGGTGITDEGLPKLYGLRNLRTLFITRTAVTPTGHQALQTAMPWIERLEYETPATN